MVRKLSELRAVKRVTDAINTGVFPEKMCSERRKNHGCKQKKTEGTRSAMSRVGTAAKCCELKGCANRVRRRTQERESPQRQILVRNLNFSPSTFTV